QPRNDARGWLEDVGVFEVLGEPDVGALLTRRRVVVGVNRHLGCRPNRHNFTHLGLTLASFWPTFHRRMLQGSKITLAARSRRWHERESRFTRSPTNVWPRLNGGAHIRPQECSPGRLVVPRRCGYVGSLGVGKLGIRMGRGQAFRCVLG